MKKLTLTLLAGCFALGLAACSSEYLISTADGTIITAATKPKLDASTGMYEFKDTDGRTQSIPSKDIKSVIER